MVLSLRRFAVTSNKEAADPKAGGVTVGSGDDVATATRFVRVGRDGFVGEEVSIALHGEAELATDRRESGETDISKLLGRHPAPSPYGPA